MIFFLSKQNEFIKAIKNKNIKEFNILLKDERVDAASNDSYAIHLAAENGCFEIFKTLLKEPNVKHNNKYGKAIIEASFYGHTDIVLLLLQKLYLDDPYICYAALNAARYGHIELTKALLKQSSVNPTEFNNTAIIDAYDNKKIEIVKLLWNDQRVKNTLQKDHEELYDKLLNKDIENKLNAF
jgi:ankyrin repeat protein